MKKFTKKLISAILLFGLIFTNFSHTVAKAEQTQDGKITVKNAIKDKNYNLYRVLDLSYNDDVKAYTYTVAKKEFETVLFGKYASLKSDNKKYDKFIIDAEPLRNGTINPYDFSIWLQDKTSNFIKEGNQITANSDNDTSISWSNLPLGYYMVTSDAGTVVSLTTTDKEVDVYEKNIKPTLTKKVKGGTASDFADLTYANIGEELTFELKFDVHNHANTEYILKDIVPKGIDILDDSLNVKLGDDNMSVGNGDPKLNYEEIKKFVSLGDNTKVLEIKFPLKTIYEISKSIRSDDKTVDGSSLNNKKTITITYKGKLNNSSLMSNHTIFTDDNVNRNKVELTYDNTIDSIKAYADVRTSEFQIKKISKKLDGGEQTLANARFRIYTDETGGEALRFTKLTSGEDYIYDSNSATIEITTTTTGVFTIKGLKPGTYYIEESAAPDGFNPLQKRVKLVIGADNNTNPTKLIYKATVEDTEESLVDNIIKVENKSGKELPETGGMGRTWIYTIGGILFFGALVLLIARKKSKEEIA